MGGRAWMAAVVLLLGGFLAFGQACPTVCVIIPEEVRCVVPRPVPDPAAETAIIQRFISYGFRVVDQDQISALRYSELVQAAIDGDQRAVQQLSTQMSARFAADILVIGEAFAEGTQVPGLFAIQSARARVEIRAIRTSTGEILAADALHTGGIDLATCELAGKKALQRAGEEIACRFAQAIARRLPAGCPPNLPRTCPVTSKTGVTRFDGDRSGAFTTIVETALSEHGCGIVQPMAADLILTGTITDFREVFTPAIPLPILDLLFRLGTAWTTVDVRVFDLSTSEVRAYRVTASVSGFEILGIRFGFSQQDLARAVGREIANRVCRGR